MLDLFRLGVLGPLNEREQTYIPLPFFKKCYCMKEVYY